MISSDLLRIRRLATWFAGMTAVIAALIMAGWLFRISPLVRLVPPYPPVGFGTAVGLLGAAAGLWGVARGRAGLIIGGGAVAFVVGALSLVGYLTGTNLEIDRLIVGDPAWLDGATPSSPRTAGASVLSLLLIGTAYFALCLRRWNRLASMLAGTLGTIVIGLSITTLMSYATGVLSESIRLATGTGIGIHAAVAFTLVGVAVVVHSWRVDAATLLPEWLPLAAGAAVLVTAVFIWRALAAEQRRVATDQLRAQAAIVANQMSIQFEDAASALRHLGTWTMENPSPAVWVTASARVVGSVDGLTAIAWLDSSLTLRAIEPGSAESDPALAEARRLLPSLLDRRQPSSRDQLIGAYVGRGPETRRYLLAVPLCASTGCQGQLIGLLQPTALLKAAVAGLAPGYSASISTGQQLVFETPNAPPRPPGWSVHYYLAAGARYWTVEIWPHPGTLTRLRSDLPGVVGGLGITLSILLAATLRLVRSTSGTARRSEREHLGRALETAKDGLWEKNLPTGEGTRSQAVWRRLGHTVDHLRPAAQESLWSSLIHPEDRRRVEAAFDRHLAGDTASFETQYRIQARDGAWHWIIDRGRVVERDDEGHPARLLGVCADITERMHAEQALAASEHRFRTVFESGLHFKVLLDVDGTVLEANRTALEYVRAEVDQVRGRKLWETPWWLGSERVERLRAALGNAGLGETVHYEEEIPAGSDQVALVDFSLTPIRDDEGKVVQLLAEGRDVTERRRNEDTMRELATLSTMGRLAAKVAHEINNPLAGIQNAFLLLKDAVPETHPHHRFVGAIEREIGRIGAITRQLYDTYRPDSDDTQVASVPTIITDAATLLGQVNRNKGVTLAIDTAASPAILGIPSGLLRQAVYNLVQNAIDASPSGGHVAVRAWQQGMVFYLTVRDQGDGVPEDLQDRIFDAFVSTKAGSTTGGMGLGLSLVRRSVEAAGGRVRAKNLAEGGAEFTIQIPVGKRADVGQSLG